jgi:hypothetical protein
MNRFLIPLVFVSRRKFFTRLLAWAAPGLVVSLPANAPGRDSDEIVSSAQKAWRDYSTFARRLQGSVDATSYSFRDGKRSLVSHWQSSFKQCGTSVLATSLVVEDTRDTKRNRGSASVLTGSGAFRLTRKNADSPWVLTHYSRDSAKPAWTKDFDPNETLIVQSQAGLCLNGVHLVDLTVNPEFAFVDASREQSEGKTLVRIKFRHHPAKYDQQLPFRDGWIRVDPARSWLMCDYEYEGKWADGAAVRRGSFEYAEGSSGQPIIRHSRELTETLPSEKSSPISETERDFKISEQDAVPAEDFRLAAFGLPEPTRQRDWPTYWYLIGGAFLCFALAAAFRWRARRLSAVVSRE